MITILVATSVGAASAASAPKHADLTVRRPAAAPTALITGTSVTAWSFRVANTGVIASSVSHAAVFLSKDARRGTGDTRIGWIAVKGIAAHGSRKVVVTLKVDAKITPGTYRLIACAVPARRQVQTTKANDCVAALTKTVVRAPAPATPAPTAPVPVTPPAAPGAAVLTSISEGGRGVTLHPSAHGTGAAAGATLSAFNSATCSGDSLGTATAAADSTFDIAFNSDIAWGQSITMTVLVTNANGTSSCSNALTYAHRGVTYTYNGSGWTGPTSIPGDSLVRIVNAPDAVVHFTDWPGAPDPTNEPPHGVVGTPGAIYTMGTLIAGHYAWYNHTGPHTDQTGSFTVTA